MLTLLGRENEVIGGAEPTYLFLASNRQHADGQMLDHKATYQPTHPPTSRFPQIFSLQDLAGDILTVMRLRLKRFLDFLETSPRAWRGLLASLDADTCQWVRSARDPEATAGGGAQSEKEAGEPLRSTHGVLLCLARALPGDSRHKVGRGIRYLTR